MADNLEVLVELINQGYKIIDKYFEKYKKQRANKNFNDLKFLIKFDDVSISWEKSVVKVLKTFNKSVYLIKFKNPIDIKPSKGSYITENSENKLSAQLRVLRDILTEAEHNQSKPTPTNNVYWIEYTINREILLNGKILCRPHPDSPNENLFNYLFNHPNQVIELKKIEESEGRDDISNNIHQKIRDLKFTGNLKKIFFPIVTKQTIQFSNPISQKYLTDNHLPHLSDVK